MLASFIYIRLVAGYLESPKDRRLTSLRMSVHTEHYFFIFIFLIWRRVLFKPPMFDHGGHFSLTEAQSPLGQDSATVASQRLL